MEPEYDITLNSAEGETSDETKSHFLNSLGLGERNVSGEAVHGGREAVDDEGVVLSSLPDNLGFSMVPSEPARGLAVSFSVSRGSDRGAPAAISLPSEEEPEPEPEVIATTQTAPEARTAEVESVTENAMDPDATLHLACPECEGALVMKRRHLGVEGACVWCHTPIVAAECARDGSVRIFPILGVRVPGSGTASKVEEAPVAETPVSEPAVVKSEAPADPVVPAALEVPAVSVPEDGFLKEESMEEAKEETKAEAVEIPAAMPTGFAPSSTELPEEPAQVIEAEVLPAIPAMETEAMAVGFVSNDPPDLDSLYDTGGFVAPTSDAAGPVLDLAPARHEETPSAGFEAAPSVPNGFGSFLQSAKPQPEPEPSAGFGGPTPWGPPTLAPVAPPSAPKLLPSPALPPDDAPPTSLPEGFSGFGAPSEPAEVPSWESAFGSSSAPEPAPAPQPDDAFAAAFGSPFGTGSAETEKAPSPFGGFAAETPSMFSNAEPPMESPAGFLASASAFATGSSVKAEAPAEPTGLFGGTGFPGSLPWGTTAAAPADEAPATLEPISPETEVRNESADLFSAAPTDAANPFGDVARPAGVSPFSALTSEAPQPAALPAPAMVVAPPALPSPAAAPMIPAAPAVPAPSTAAPAVAPQVAALPLSAKPKPKVRKGFVVLMVVILGFASGAALASYVLPVERYVEAARAFMEAKFAPKPAVPVMPQLQTLPTEPLPGNGAAPTADSQN